MFKIEVIDLKVFAVIGVSENERKKRQLLKVNFTFSYYISKNKNLNEINHLPDYSIIVKFLKGYIEKSKFKTLEKLISESVLILSKKFKLKDIKLKINKTKVAKKYGAKSLSVSN